MEIVKTEVKLSIVLRIIARAMKVIMQTYPILFLMKCLFMLYEALIPVFLVKITTNLINNVQLVIENPGVDSYLFQSFYLLFLQLIMLITGFLAQSAITYIQKSADLKTEFYFQDLFSRSMQNIPLVEFENWEFYNKTQRISNSGPKSVSIIDSLLIILKNFITLVGFISILFSYSPIVSMIFIFCALPIYFFNIKMSRYKYQKVVQNTELNRKSNYFSELFKEKKVSSELKIFNHGDFLLNRWRKYYNLFAKKEMKIQKQLSLYSLIIFLSNSIVIFAISISLIVIGSKNKITIGVFVALLQALNTSQSIINEIIIKFSSIYENTLYAMEYFSFTDSFGEVRTTRSQGLINFPKLKHGLQAKNISFNYPNSNVHQLKNISLNIGLGERVVVVGDNGAGKTTLIKCLLGLYPIQEGEVLYDEINVRDIDPESFVNNVSVIFQNFSQYNLSLKDNITLSENMNIKDFEQAIQTAGLGELVDKLPHRYDTELGNQFTGGLEISGGQWQKIALARTLYINPQVIVFDEAFSALDPIAENKILEQFSEVTKGKISIFISHRMSTTKFADKILVMKDGELIEQGNHDTLMNKDSYYKKLYTSQSKWYNAAKSN